MKLHLLQLTSSPEVAANLAAVAALVEQAAPAPGDLLLLPENFAVFAGDSDHLLDHAEAPGTGPVQQFLAELARRWQITVVAGTQPLRPEAGHHQGKAYAACLIYGSDGQLLSRYNKIHLFDVEVSDGTGRYRESDSILAGDQLCLFEAGGIRIGVMVCYDLRFPELARLYAEAGAQLLLVPAAFTAVTGAAHWQLLLRARAVENQLFVAASGQTGHHANGRHNWGHSMLVDPWGTVVADGGSAPGITSVSPDWTLIEQVRQRMPLPRHNRFACNWRED